MRNGYQAYIIRYMANYRNNKLNDTTNILKALSDPNRIRIVMSLSGGELCVCRIIELLQLAPSTVSKHLSILRQADLIEASKKGRWIYYKLSNHTKNKTLKEIVKWLEKSLKEDDRITKDKKLMARILKEDPEKLCAKIKKK